MEKISQKEELEKAKETAKKKAEELSSAFGCKVYPLVFAPEGESIAIGFLKEPPRFVKLKMLDRAATQSITAASEVVDAYLIREHSDERIYSEASVNDLYYLGACLEAEKTVSIAINQLKKN